MKAALILCPAVASAASLNPVSKVIQMLTDMKVSGTKAIEDEAQVMHDYNNFVLRNRQEFEYQVKTGIAKGEELTATIQKAESDVNLFGEKIKELDGQIKTLENDKATANTNRAAGAAEYDKQHQDYDETLYAIDAAITTLQSTGGDKPQAMMMLQQAAKGGADKKSRGMRRVLAEISLLQGGDDDAPNGAPSVAAYESQTGGVVEMLTALKDKFRKEIGDLEKEEMNSVSAHSVVLTHLEEVIRNLQREHEANVQSKAAASKTAAEAKGELSITENKLTEDKKMLEELNVTFDTKKATFEENQKVRKEEVEALGKAVEMLSSPEIQGNYEKHVKSLLAEGWPLVKKGPIVSLLQMGSQKRAMTHKSAVEFLRSRASALRSTNLADLVSKATDSPFAKVIEMVEGLLAKLAEEASSEADHKAFCDEELKNNKLERNELEATAARLRAEADAAAAKVKEMADEIAALAAQQAELQQAMAEATTQRSGEKELNLAAIKDAKLSQTAVAQATAVLKEFYEKQGGSFLQRFMGKQVPEMEAYSGMQGKSGGVMGMLEVIQSDFARLETDTSAAEDQAASEYATFMEDSEADNKMKHDAEFKLSLDKDQKDFEREQAEKDFAATTEQLDKSNAYYQELKPQCIDVNVSFEERTKMRQEEIKALNEAYDILAEKASF